MVIYDKYGLIMVAAAKHLQTPLEVVEAKSKAFFYGLQITKDVGFKELIAEMDCL